MKASSMGYRRDKPFEGTSISKSPSVHLWKDMKSLLDDEDSRRWDGTRKRIEDYRSLEQDLEAIYDSVAELFRYKD